MRSDDHVTHDGQPTDGLDRTAPQHDAAEQHDAPEQHDAAPLPDEPAAEQHHADEHEHAEHEHAEHPHHDPDAHRHPAGHGCGHHERHGFGRLHGDHRDRHGFGREHGDHRERADHPRGHGWGPGEQPHGRGEQPHGSAPGFGPREHGFGHREHGFAPHRHGFGHGGRGRPTLARSIVKSARRIRHSGLTPEQLQHRIATTVSHADYVTTMRTLRRIGMDLRHQR
ncbi:hypothetical protein ACVWW9_000869 [Agrococcus sp. UYP33]